jgi:hypothetical protein
MDPGLTGVSCCRITFATSRRDRRVRGSPNMGLPGRREGEWQRAK